MELTTAELNLLLLLALNDREGVLSTDWQRASDKDSTSLMMTLCEELREVRTLSYKLTAAVAAQR